MDQDQQPTGTSSAEVVTSRRIHGLTVVELSNGLRIVVREDRRTPVAICQIS